CGRLLPGLLTDVIGWRAAFQVVALLTLLAAIIVAVTLPRERNFTRSGGLATSALQTIRHLRNRRLVATYAIGFGVLFNFVATFTYVNFHLAAAPYNFSPTLLAPPCVTFRGRGPTVRWGGAAIRRSGGRRFVLGVIAIWVIGALLLLAPPLVLIIAGLTLCAVCGMVCQAISTGYVTLSAKEGRSSAVGLYASIYYIGGSAGAFVTGLAWARAGWSGCVAVIVFVQVIIAVIVAAAWD